jgi:hypothetical protein
LGPTSYFNIAGNFGVGTTTPAKKVDIVTSVNGNEGVFVLNNSTGASAQAIIQAGTNGALGVQLGQNYSTKNAFLYLGDNANLTVSVNAANRLTVNNGGFVLLHPVGGSFGGQLQLQKAPTGSTLVGNAAIDTSGNVIRFFDTGSPFRGAYLDLSTSATGVQSKLLTSTETAVITSTSDQVLSLNSTGSPYLDITKSAVRQLYLQGTGAEAKLVGDNRKLTLSTTGNNNIELSVNSTLDGYVQDGGSIVAINEFRAGDSSQTGEKRLALQNSSRNTYFYLNSDNVTVGLYDATTPTVRWSTNVAGNFTANGSIGANNGATVISNTGITFPSNITQVNAAMIWRGTYNPATQYRYNDTIYYVEFDGSFGLWIYNNINTPATGQAPFVGSTYWAVIMRFQASVPNGGGGGGGEGGDNG